MNQFTQLVVLILPLSMSIKMTLASISIISAGNQYESTLCAIVYQLVFDMLQILPWISVYFIGSLSLELPQATWDRPVIVVNAAEHPQQFMTGNCGLCWMKGWLGLIGESDHQWCLIAKETWSQSVFWGATSFPFLGPGFLGNMRAHTAARMPMCCGGAVVEYQLSLGSWGDRWWWQFLMYVNNQKQ